MMASADIVQRVFFLIAIKKHTRQVNVEVLPTVEYSECGKIYE